VNRALYTIRLLLGLLDAAWGAPGDPAGSPWLHSLRELLVLIAEGDYARARQILKHMEAEHPPFTE
jgi:hypothetical protein